MCQRPACYVPGVRGAGGKYGTYQLTILLLPFKGKKILAHAVLILASFLSVFPLYYMLCGATNTSIDVVRGKLIPGTYLVENFKSLVANQNLGLAMANSFRNAILMTLITLLVCSIAGYGFEIYHDKAKDALMNVLLLAMMLPFVAIMIPLFKMMSHWGLVNSWAAFVLPSISTPFMIMLFRQASRSFPNDIIEAARLDGLSEIGIFFRMFVPIMRSTYGAAMTVTFIVCPPALAGCGCMVGRRSPAITSRPCLPADGSTLPLRQRQKSTLHRKTSSRWRALCSFTIPATGFTPM